MANMKPMSIPNSSSMAIHESAIKHEAAKHAIQKPGKVDLGCLVAVYPIVKHVGNLAGGD